MPPEDQSIAAPADFDFTPPAPKRSQLRGLIRDYVLDHLREHPDARYEEALPTLKEQLSEDFEGSPFLPVLLQLLEMFLPLLLALLKK